MRSTVKTTAGATEAVTAAEDAEVVLAASGGGAPRAAGMSARGGRRTSASGRLDADVAGTIVGATWRRDTGTLAPTFSSGIGIATARGSKTICRHDEPGERLPLFLSGSPR
jgi:hypothetical protein